MIRFTLVRGAQAMAVGLGAMLLTASQAVADNVIADDLIVQGSACVGLDCVNGESFGFATLRLKENNTRIDFVDTSASAGFTTRDWRLEANSSASGGANYFAIKDMGDDNSTGAEGGTALFTVTAGAPVNSLFVDSIGRVGVGTATPGLKFHILNGDTPGMRLEQDGSGSFTPQTWDVAGNEANFFVRDVTGGSRLPFRIRPGAPTSSIDISANGFVGVGTASPQNTLHLASAGNTTLELESLGTAKPRWGISAIGGTGLLMIRDFAAGTNPIRIRPGAPSSSIEITGTGAVGIGTPSPGAQLEVAGSVRFASLANCTGLQTNSRGTLSCAPPPAHGAKLVAGYVAGDRQSPGTAQKSSNPGAVASLGGQAGGEASSAPGANAADDTCGPGDMAGRWSLIGTNIEMVGANSVLWCDVDLTPAPDGAKPNYSIAGTCRSHVPNQTTPDHFTIVGDKSIVVTDACQLGGTFKVRHGGAVITTASIVEGRLEGPASRKTRAVAVSRWPRGTTSAIQTFVMER